MVDANTRGVLELLKRPGNDICADCGTKGMFKNLLNIFFNEKDLSFHLIFQGLNGPPTTLAFSFVQGVLRFTEVWEPIFRKSSI